MSKKYLAFCVVMVLVVAAMWAFVQNSSSGSEEEAGFSLPTDTPSFGSPPAASPQGGNLPSF